MNIFLIHQCENVTEPGIEPETSPILEGDSLPKKLSRYDYLTGTFLHHISNILLSRFCCDVKAIEIKIKYGSNILVNISVVLISVLCKKAVISERYLKCSLINKVFCHIKDASAVLYQSTNIETSLCILI